MHAGERERESMCSGYEMISNYGLIVWHIIAGLVRRNVSFPEIN